MQFATGRTVVSRDMKQISADNYLGSRFQSRSAIFPTEMQLTVRLGGIGISLVDATPRELLYLAANGIRLQLLHVEPRHQQAAMVDAAFTEKYKTSLSYSTSSDHSSFMEKITHEGSSATLDTLPPGTMALHVGFSVSGLQIDNQLHTTQYPVFLHTDHNAKEGALRLPSTLDISSDIPEGPEYSFLADSNSTMISQVASILKSRSDPVRQSVSRSGRNGRPRGRHSRRWKALRRKNVRYRKYLEKNTRLTNLKRTFSKGGSVDPSLSPLDDNSEEEEQELEDSDDSDESEFETASGSSQDFDHDDIESDEEDHHSVGSREQLDNGLESDTSFSSVEVRDFNKKSNKWTLQRSRTRKTVGARSKVLDKNHFQGVYLSAGGKVERQTLANIEGKKEKTTQKKPLECFSKTGVKCG